MNYYQANPYGHFYEYSWQPPAPYSAQYNTPQQQPTLPQPITLPAPISYTAPPQTAVAYTSVATLQPRPSAPEQNEGSTSNWPQALRRYVERAFAAAGQVAGRASLQERLKEIIKEVKERGELWTNDWDSMPLPGQPGSAQSGAAHPQSGAAHQAQVQYRTPAVSLAVASPQRGRREKRARSRSSVSPPQRMVNNTDEQDARSRAAWTNTEPGVASPEDHLRERARIRRFGNGLAVGALEWRQAKLPSARRGASQADPGSYVELENSFQDEFVVRGTCQEVEKSYFRLTSKPDPSTVRPEAVLWKALHRLVALLEDRKVTYFYAADQFKGMRQDCTVQHLRNELSASIYEAHARSALEYGDTGEFNQCQGQLVQHYDAGVAGCREEFLAYRILYQAVHAGKEDRVALLMCLQSVSPEDAQHPPVRHALQVRQALASGDNTHVCMLYLSAPNMGRALLDTVLPKVRFTALRAFAKAYQPLLPMSFIARRLGFLDGHSSLQGAEYASAHTLSATSPTLPGCTQASYPGRFAPKVDDQDGYEACRLWLLNHGAVLVAMPGTADALGLSCKESASRLLMPEKVAAVAHGDANLAIDDFLARTIS